MSRPRVIVIGSGFGGSVFAYRLAASGRFDVRVLERGQEFAHHGFPRRPGEVRANVWDPAAGLTGMFEYRSFDKSKLDVLTAAGVGGGSLIYSNVLYRMDPPLFQGWPGGLCRTLLDPYYQRVEEMMEARPYPMDRPDWPYASTPKSIAYERAARYLAHDSRGKPAATLILPPLAVQFGARPGASIKNRHGAEQAACTRCGECNFGCNVGAKNTLDLNYLYAARTHHGAVIEPFHEVRSIAPRPEGGYTVSWVDPRYPLRPPQTLEAEYVVLAAGSLGSSRLLLRMKQAGILPALDESLGTAFSPNGDTLGFVCDVPDSVPWDCGPTITSSLHVWSGGYADGLPHELFVQNCGFPNFLFWYLTALFPSTQSRFQAAGGAWRYLRGIFGRRRRVNLIKDLGRIAIADQPGLLGVFALLGMGRDRSTGVMTLRGRDRDQPAEIHIKWSPRPSALHYDRMREAMSRIAEAMGGTFYDAPNALANRLITVHPVGGCPLADPDAEEATSRHPRRPSPRQRGVVNAATGEVFGHPNLYVVDGSILPTAAGPNPSLTIAALAELYAERFCAREGQAT